MADTRTWFRKNEIKVMPWLFLLPGLLFFLVYVIVPIFQSFNISLYEWDGLGEATFIGMGNYEELLDDFDFYVSLRNNLYWLVLYLLAIPAGLFIALFLNQTVTGIRLYKSLFFFPFVISQVVVGLVFTWFYDPNFGLLNHAIDFVEPVVDPVLFALAAVFGLLFPIYDVIAFVLIEILDFVKTVLALVVPNSWEPSWLAADWSRTLGEIPNWLKDDWEGLERVNVLGDPDLVTFGIIAAGLWPQTAYCMILYLTGLNSVDPEQVEAGRLDGAKGWRMLWYIIIPQLRPATFIAFVVTIIGALRSFDLISIMTNGGPFGESRVLSFYMFEVALSEYGFRMGYGAAIAVVLFLIMLAFIAYFLWQMYQDEKEARR